MSSGHPPSTTVGYQVSQPGASKLQHNKLVGAPIHSSLQTKQGCDIPHTHANGGVSKPTLTHAHKVKPVQTAGQKHAGHVQSLQDKFNQKLSEYISLYQSLTGDMAKDASARAPLAPYANSIIFDQTVLDSDSKGKAVCDKPSDYLYFDKDDNFAPWCCPDPPTNQTHSHGMIIGKCGSSGGGKKAQALIDSAYYINGYGYAQHLSPNYFSQKPVVPMTETSIQ